MLVSIVTPLYNSGEYISKTIDSVLAQTYTNWELIIVDDCSKDDGVRIVKKYQEIDNRIKLLQNVENLGAAKSRNKAINSAKGRFIAFLDSDDLWFSEKLEKQIKFMDSNKYPFTYTFYNQINEQEVFVKAIDKIPYKVNYNSTIRSNKIGCLTVIYDKNHFGKVLMPDIRKRQDYALWLQLLKKCNYAYCLPEILANYRLRKNSISSNKFDLIKYHWKLYREIEGHSFFKSTYYLIYCICSVIFR